MSKGLLQPSWFILKLLVKIRGGLFCTSNCYSTDIPIVNLPRNTSDHKCAKPYHLYLYRVSSKDLTESLSHHEVAFINSPKSLRFLASSAPKGWLLSLPTPWKLIPKVFHSLFSICWPEAVFHGSSFLFLSQRAILRSNQSRAFLLMKITSQLAVTPTPTVAFSRWLRHWLTVVPRATALAKLLLWVFSLAPFLAF